MSRAGYSDDGDNWDCIRWSGAVKSAIRGKRGQAFLREMAEALDAMPIKELIAKELVLDGAVCALGAVGIRRGLDMSRVNAYDRDEVAELLGIAPAMAAEISYENDDFCSGVGLGRQKRWAYMRKWVDENLK